MKSFLIPLLFVGTLPGISRGEAPDTSKVWPELVKQVAIGVTITEGMNYLYRNQKKIWAPLKSLERYRAVKVMKDAGLIVWDYYMVWKKAIDNVAGFVDDVERSKLMIEQAERTAKYIIDYYQEFEWQELRLTNLSDVIPGYSFRMLDFYLNGSLFYAAKAVDHLAFSSLLMEDVIYNPARRNRIIVSERMLRETYAEISRQNAFLNHKEKGMDKQLKDLEDATVSSDDPLHAGENYHVSATLASLAYDLHHTRVRTHNKAMQNTMMVLDLITAEARDWQKEGVFFNGLVHDDWASKNAFALNGAPVVFNRDLEIDFVK